MDFDPKKVYEEELETVHIAPAMTQQEVQRRLQAVLDFCTVQTKVNKILAEKIKTLETQSLTNIERHRIDL